MQWNTSCWAEGGGRKNLAAEAVAACVLSGVLSPDVHLESPNDNENLSPLLEVVDNLEAEDKDEGHRYHGRKNKHG